MYSFLFSVQNIQSFAHKKMIGCYLSGGLGNQLFQIFTTLAYCMEHDKVFVFPKHKNYIRENNRPTYWDTILRGLSPYTTENYSEILQNKRYNEPHHYYTPIPQPHEIVGENGCVVLKGYFQCFKYFHTRFETIMRTYEIDQLRNDLVVKSRFFENPNEHTISIHFRFGDYKHIRCYHPVLSPEYYVLALRHILQKRAETESPKSSDKRTVVYCFYEHADVELVDEYLDKIWKDISPTYEIEFRKIEPTYQDWEQMLLMSGCEDHIIANSTFSWWSAYINPRSDKIVCYPNAWYGHQLYYIQTMDMFPPEWTCIAHDHSFYHSFCKCLK
jgi:hypothetical protein